MFFKSDNTAAVHPDILAAVGRAAEGYATPYGNDPLTAACEARLRDVFGHPEARVFLVATGTAANALALATICQPWQTVFCHRDAHIEVDECAAPEFFTGGAKLTLLPGADAKLAPADLAAAIAATGTKGVHGVQRGALSLSEATEMGAAYTVDEVRALCDVAHAGGLRVHMDGTRFANAVAHLGCTPAELSWQAGVDVLCLGATKNGAMAAEAVVLFDPALAWEFELRRKRGGHLFSKMRFVAAQMDAYLTDGLWLRLAAHANAMAARLEAGINATNHSRVLNARGANMLFAEMPLSVHRRLVAAGAQYYAWPEGQDEAAPDDARISVRLVPSFQTREADVDRFLAVLAA